MAASFVFWGGLSSFRTPRPAVRDGIAYVTEDRKVEGIFETMSIAESIHIGALAASKSRSWLVNRREMRDLAARWISALSIRAINSNARVLRSYPVAINRKW